MLDALLFDSFCVTMIQIPCRVARRTILYDDPTALLFCIPPLPLPSPHSARKNKKLIKMKVQQTSTALPAAGDVLSGGGGGGGSGAGLPNGGLNMALVPSSMPQLVPTMLSLLKAIEPEVVYSGYDNTLPDTSTRLMTTLNRLGGQQVISAVKWAKSLPGTRGKTSPRIRVQI